MSSSWQSEFINTNGLRLHYTRTGGPKPALVLAHGVTDDGLCWSPVAAALAPDYDVIMANARGHGLSAAPLESYGPIEQAGDLAGLLKALDLKHPIILGHSMGAITALVLAARQPQLLQAIALEDPPPWWESAWDRPYTPGWQVQMRAWITTLQQQPRQALIDAQRAETPQWSDAELEPWADAKLRFSLNFFNRLSDPALDWPALLRQVTCPALLISGDPDAGALVTQQAALALKEHVPQLQIAHISGAGHSIRRYQFEDYLRVVRSLLAEVTARAVAATR
jgi:pimeloyl-ACP methyl ester carboxylesterase